MKKIVFLFMFIFVFSFSACTASQPEPAPTEPAPTEPVAAPVELTTEPVAEVEASAEPTAEPAPTEPVAEVDVTDDEADEELIAFIEQLQTAVTQQDFTSMEALMSDPIGVGPWRAEWQTLSAQEAVEQLRGGSLPYPANVIFTGINQEEIAQLLSVPPDTMLGPDVNVAAVLHSSGWGQSAGDDALLFITDEDGQYHWSAFLYTTGRFADAYLEVVPPPAGLITIIWNEGVYRIEPDGSQQELFDQTVAETPNIRVSPDGRYAAYLTDNNELWLVDGSTGQQEQLAAERSLSGFLMWGSDTVLFTGVWLDPNEGEGPNNGHIATINIEEEGRPLTILDETRLSSSRPALSPDGQTVAFDVFQTGPDDITSRLYHYDSGLTVFDPGAFEMQGEMIDQARFNPSFSPDGRFMTWLSSTGERVGLQLYDLQEESARQIFDWDPARFGALIPSPIWSPDGQWLALEVWANGPQGSGLWLIDPDGGSQNLIDQTLIDSQGRDPVWINEKQIVFGVNGGLRRYDLESGTLAILDLPVGSWPVGYVSATDLIDPAELPANVEVVPSPDDRWLASASQSEPLLVNDVEKFYASLSVTDGAVTWTPVAEWRNHGLGYTWPAVYSWSDDGRFLYYTNRTSPDGCAVFAGGTDLYRLDTADGAVTELIPPFATLSFTMAYDDSAVAYTHWDGQQYWLRIKDLAGDTEESIAITDIGQPAQAGNIVWSPDQGQVFAVIVYDACLPTMTYSLIQVDRDTEALTTHIERSEEQIHIQDWPDPARDVLRLAREDGRIYLLDLATGDLTAE
ncbi:MAG: hypothetical protein R3293_15025 [Candidatus Promineifilaceae bacterium]|nr:hypothetical protein [Candidatus Promineifilaceae bacterium]